MANDLSKLTQDVKNTQSEVDILKGKIVELTQALEQLLLTASKSGGIATPAGLEASKQRVLEDPEKWGGRTGGGSRIRIKEEAEEIRKQAQAVNNVSKEWREQSTLLDRVKGQLKELQKTPIQLDLDITNAQQKLDNLRKLIRQAQAELKDLAFGSGGQVMRPSVGSDDPSKYRVLTDKQIDKSWGGEDAESFKKSAQSIRDKIAALNDLQKEEKELTSTFEERAEAQRELNKIQDAENAEKRVADIAQEVSQEKELTGAIREQTQARQELAQERKRVRDTLPPSPDELMDGLGTGPKGTKEQRIFSEDEGLKALAGQSKEAEVAAKSLQVAIENVNKEIGKYGDSVTGQQTSIRLLENGLRQYDTTIVTAGGATRKFTQYLDENNRILTKAQVEARETAAAAKELATAFKNADAARYDIAAKAAAKAGFDPEKDLKDVYTQHPSGVSFLKYEMEDGMGVTQKYEVVLDKFGKELNRTNRRLLGFAESVKKNTIELIKWSVGVTLVYGTYYKFQQLLETAIDNQSKLAVVAVTLGNAQRDLNDIFDDAAKVALLTGESINAVLETYTYAYRAVGAIADPMIRTAKANQLLTDATILNKLSSLDAASSIDVLAGSLRQLQGPAMTVGEAFDYGTDLLDKWVVTTRNANVDLATLATAFSVTAESAMNAGMSVEELNAVIASLAEKIGGLGGRETGNAVRALIGGVYQEQATTILAKYGIAVKDTAGQMRDFLEISRDIYELYDQEIISASELNKIGLVLGGGVRRGQQYVAYLSDFGNVLEIVEKQSNSSGASQQALGIIMDTLQVTLTKLSNSVQNLAQTMGTEGGLLGAANSVLKVMTFLVDTTEQLVSLFGKLTLPAALLGLGAGYFSLGGSIGQAKRADFAGKIGSGTQNMMGGMMGMLPFFQKSDLQNIKPVVGSDGKISHFQKVPTGLIALPPGVSMGGIQKTGAQTIPARAGAFMQQNYWGMMPGALAAVSRVGEEDYAGAGITMAATIGGALVGGPWGALFGTMIAETFIAGMRDAEADLTDILVSPLQEYTEEEKGVVELSDLEARRKINTEAVLAEGTIPILGLLDTFVNNMNAKIFQAFGAEGAPIYGQPTNLFEKPEKLGYIKPGVKVDEMALMYLELEAARYDALKKSGRALNDATKARHQEIQVLIEEAKLLSSRSLDPISIDKSTFSIEMKRLNEDFGGYLNDLSVGFQKQLRTQVTEGEIPTKEFTTGLETAQGARLNVLAIQAALSIASGIAEMRGEGEKIPITKKNMEEFFNLVTEASPDVVTTLTQMTTKIVDLSAGLDSLEGLDVTATVNIEGIDWTREQLEDQIIETLKDIPIYAEFAKDALEDMAMAKIPQPQMVMTGFEDRTTAQMDMVIQKARDLQDEQLKAIYQADPTDEMGIDWYEWQTKQAGDAQPIFVYLGELMGYHMAKGLLGTEYLNQALEDLVNSMQIPDLEFGYQFLDTTQAQMQTIMPQYEAIRQSILSAGGKSEESALLTFFSNSSSPVYMQKDWTIIQFLLGQLLKTEQNALKTNRDQLKAAEKQLEGIYNLPGGASFYVPFDAYAMKYKPEEEGGIPDFEIPVQDFQIAVDKFGSILDQYKNYNVEAIQSLVGVFEYMETQFDKNRPTQPKTYDVEAIQSLAGMKFPEEPIDTNVLNIGDILMTAGGNLLENIVTALTKTFEVFFPPKTEESTSAEDAKTIKTYDVEAIQSSLSPLTSKLSELVSQLTLQNKQGLGSTEFDLAETLSGGAITLSDINFTTPDVSTKLSMNVDVRTTLHLDGQEIWDSIKDYARTDLVNYGGVAGSASANYTFA